MRESGLLPVLAAGNGSNAFLSGASTEKEDGSEPYKPTKDIPQVFSRKNGKLARSFGDFDDENEPVDDGKTDATVFIKDYTGKKLLQHPPDVGMPFGPGVGTPFATPVRCALNQDDVDRITDETKKLAHEIFENKHTSSANYNGPRPHDEESLAKSLKADRTKIEQMHCVNTTESEKDLREKMYYIAGSNYEESYDGERPTLNPKLSPFFDHKDE